MKTLLFAFLMSAAVRASAITTAVCPPTPATDTIPITAGCGLDPLTATPNASYWFGWNDNPVNLSGNDHDFCDICGFIRLNSDGSQALVTYLGQAAASNLTMFYGSTPLFNNFATPPGSTAVIATTPNAAILFSLHVDYIHGGHFDFPSTDRNYFRDGCLSQDCAPHGEPHGEVPEVATILTAGLGLVLLGSLKARANT